MQTVLIILIVLAALAALFSLIRGIIGFLRTTEAELKSGAEGPSHSSKVQNKAMFQRIQFQAIAVLLCVVLLYMAR